MIRLLMKFLAKIGYLFVSIALRSKSQSKRISVFIYNSFPIQTDCLEFWEYFSSEYILVLI